MVQVLRLRGNPLGEEGASSLAEAVRAGDTLLDLDVGSCEASPPFEACHDWPHEWHVVVNLVDPILLSRSVSVFSCCCWTMSLHAWSWILSEHMPHPGDSCLTCWTQQQSGWCCRHRHPSPRRIHWIHWILRPLTRAAC